MYYADFPIIGAESELPLFLVSVGLNQWQYHIIKKNGDPCPLIIYSTRGSGTLILNGEKHIVAENSGFFVPALCPHEYYTNGEEWDTHWIIPSGYAVSRTLEKLGLDRPRLFSLRDVKLLEHFFREMHDALIGDRLFGNYRAAGYLYDFLIELYRQISSSEGNGQTNRIILKVVDYINSCYTSEITMDDLCSVAGVSKQHLCRLFQSSLSARPMEYIAKRRIQAAKVLLSENDKSIEQIAEQTGFCSASYFCKLFKRYELITPSEFRKG